MVRVYIWYTGMGDEVSQLAIPSRTFALDDLAFSLAGVLVFGLTAAVIEWIKHLCNPN